MAETPEQAMEALRRSARELAPESDSPEEFVAAMGLGNVCERCGREGLDDEDYTACDLIPDSENPGGPDLLLCRGCIGGDA
jgi:hypothetical protein